MVGKKVDYNPGTGEYSLNMDGEYSLYEQTSDSETKFPHKCPQCEVAYYVKDKNSVTPIRYHGTGLQKVNQILADSLIRSMKKKMRRTLKLFYSRIADSLLQNYLLVLSLTILGTFYVGQFFMH